MPRLPFLSAFLGIAPSKRLDKLDKFDSINVYSILCSSLHNRTDGNATNSQNRDEKKIYVVQLMPIFPSVGGLGTK